MNHQELQLFKDTIKFGGDQIFIKPFCDFFEISYNHQTKVIREDKILSTSTRKNIDMLLFGDKKARITLSPRGFIRWIQLINPRTVPVSLQDKLEVYQNFIFDFMYGNWEERQNIGVKHARLTKLQRLYSKVGNEIQGLQRELKNYVSDQLRIDYTYQRIK